MRLKLNIPGIFLVISMIFACSWAQASERWTVPEETALYSRPSFESISDDQLEPGAQIYVSSNPIMGFRHVLILPAAKQTRRLAYILESDYQGWLKQKYESDRWAVWAGPIYSFIYEPPRSVTTNLNATYTISPFSGSAFFYALGASYKMSNNWRFRFGFVQRTVNVSGSVIEQDIPATSEYSIVQSFFGVLAGLRYTPAGWTHFRVDMQAEYSQGQHVSLTTISGAPLDTSALQLGGFFVLSTGFDYQWRLSPHWSLEPALRMGINTSISPIILSLEGESDLAYSF